MNGSEKTLIGQTPIDYTKTALPTDAPFLILFEKPGFEPREVSVSPTDNSQTTIATTLKPSKDSTTDAATKRTREILKKIFEVQQMTASQKYVDALAALSKLEEKEPNIAEINVIKGSIYVLINDHVQAKKEWEKALKVDSSLDDVRIRIKNLNVAAKLNDEAKPNTRGAQP